CAAVGHQSQYSTLLPLDRGKAMNTTNIQSHSLPDLRSSTVVSSLIGAMLIGVVIVFAIGFSSTDAAHNAAHDMRHSNAFPCH
ncbi:MAG: CbtB domain-containing protein, partial [Acidiferrobacterales bacterium]